MTDKEKLDKVLDGLKSIRVKDDGFYTIEEFWQIQGGIQCLIDFIEGDKK